MQTKTITIRGKQLQIGYGPGPEGVGRGTYIIEKEDTQVRCFFMISLLLNDPSKIIEANWKETVLLPVSELKPLQDYFDFDTKVPKNHVREIFEQDHPSRSFGKVPGTNIYKYDGYGNALVIPGDNRFDTTYRPVLDVFFFLKYGVHCVSDTGQLIQPVTADITYGGTEEVNTIGVAPIDGIAPFQFSVDGIDWSTNNELQYPKVAGDYKAYVKDSVGTKFSINLEASNWPQDVQE